jgi:hypothetical protein
MIRRNHYEIQQLNLIYYCHGIPTSSSSQEHHFRDICNEKVHQVKLQLLNIMVTLLNLK